MKGWRTKRRIVVFSSDDWGSIRMPDKATYDKLLAKGIRVDKCVYNRYDSLASEDDLTALFEVLNNYNDKYGNPPIITANCVIANPDFDRIRNSGFKEYHFELFTETLKKYPKHSFSFKLWQEGIHKKLFYPQFHGREHLNVARWMKGLELNLPETRLAFDLNLFGIGMNITTENRKNYLEALAIDQFCEEMQINKITAEGLLLFEKIFGFQSRSFIAPNNIWPSSIEKELVKQNIKYIQGQRRQWMPAYNSSKGTRIAHFTGQLNKYGQVFIIRNCQFEPSFDNVKDPVDACLAQIDNAFRWRKPAVITTHRVNFIGSIDHSNRDRNMRHFKDLLSGIQKKWPDMEYMTVNKLGDLILSENAKE